MLYLFSNEFSSHLKQVFYILFLSVIFFGCGSSISLNSIIQKLPEKPIRVKKPFKFYKFKYYITYSLKFPFKPSSKGGKGLYVTLSEYEKIVNNHVDYKKNYKKKIKNKPTILSKFNKRSFIKETIEQKNLDIILIKDLAKKYQEWGTEWDNRAESLISDISLNDVKKIKREIKEISKRL